MTPGGRVPSARFVRTITVTSAVFNLFTANPTDFAGGTDNAQNPVELTFTVETNPVRFTENGTNPTASLGLIVPANGMVTIRGWDNIKRLLMFRAGAADATVNYTVYF